MRLLNLGCGSRFHEAWINVDFSPMGDGVISHDLKCGIPFPDNYFDVVYHSHLLEHFPKNYAPVFLQESYRVLKPSGLTRVCVPDLEQIARLYLKALDKAKQDHSHWNYHYDWILLEMLDQTVRERSGGEMAIYLRQHSIPNKDFVLERIGMEGNRVIEGSVQTRTDAPIISSANIESRGVLNHIIRFMKRRAIDRESIVRRVLGEEYELLKLARFRRSGEIHLWMYDRFSLARILKQSGFNEPKSVGPEDSEIPGWREFGLDTEPDGSVY